MLTVFNDNASWESSEDIHTDLILIKQLIYDTYGLMCSSIKLEKESAEYGAAIFKLNTSNILFRVAKITPKKIGQFVTLWKRANNGKTRPQDISDAIDFIVVNTRKNHLFGQFVFPISVLLEKNIVSLNEKGGKRGIRVYPPWDKVISKQAKKTQQWQLNYFLNLSETCSIDKEKISWLYSNTPKL